MASDDSQHSLTEQDHQDMGDVEQNEQVLFSEVVAVLNELGHYNRLTNTYQLNTRDHNSCLRDLIRFLRNDGNSFLVRRQMGISNIVNNDLLPIVEQHTVNSDCNITETGKSIMDKVIRLLVDLTNPTVLHYKDQIIPKDDKYEMPIYMQLQSVLYQYKLAFASHKRFWIVLSKHLTRILELDNENRQVEDELMLERIIVLIRNVLHIPIIASNQEIDDETNVHDRLIEQLSNSGILDILQYIISSEEHQNFCFHMIEIMYLMFREQNAEFLAKSFESDKSLDSSQNTEKGFLLLNARSQYERECDRKEFEEVRNRDRQEMIQLMSKTKADDFTRFNGSAFVIKNLKSISDRDMICHRAYVNPEKAIDLNKNKIAQRRARNRRPMNENVANSDSLGIQRIHRSNRKLRIIMYEFCGKFLEESYNTFMGNIRSNLSRGNAQQHDETYYLWAIQFFMEFSRSRSNASAEEKYKQVYQTMATSTFHYLQTQVDDYLDHLSQKKEFKNVLGDWSKRLHYALRSYRELLYSLSSLERLNLPEASKMCHRIKMDIFTEPEYRELLLRLIQAYNEERMSKAYLRDLIETNHIFLKMLDYHSKISFNFKVKVKRRKQVKRKSKNSKEKQNQSESITETEDNETLKEAPEDIWIDIIDEVSEALKSDSITEMVHTDDTLKALFDPLSEKTLDEQKLDIMRTIGNCLRQKEVRKAVGLFREARNALAGVDEDNVFGELGISVEDELLALNEILMTEFPEMEEKNKKNDDKIVDEEEEEIDEEEDQEQNMSLVQEKNFSIDDTIRRYAHPNVVRAYRLLLKYYKTNSAFTNHAIVRMLHRIAVGLKMAPMFYNLGYFILFEQILDDPCLRKGSSSQNSVVQELAVFAHYIVRNFFKLLAKYPNIACELCFIVNSRDAYGMEYGFEEEVVSQMKKRQKGNGWSEEQELELEVLYKEYKDKATKEKDIVDLIQEHMIDDTKTRRQILVQLKKMDLVQPSDLKKNSYKGSSWSEEEKEELTSLYEKFKDNVNFDENVEEIEILDENIEIDSKDKLNLTTTIEPSFIRDSQLNMDDDESNTKHNRKDIADESSEISSTKNNKNKVKQTDLIDCILKNLSTRDIRNRRQVIRQLKLMNIYDHSLGKKWTKDQIDELRTVFCSLFVDFKEHQALESIEPLVNENEDTKESSSEMEHFSNVDVKVNSANFIQKLMEKFSDKTKTNRQILRQLKKMNFGDSLQVIGIDGKRPNKSTSKASNGVESSQEDEANTSDDYDEEDNDDEEVVDDFDGDKHDNIEKKSRKVRKSKSDEESAVVVQYDSDDDNLESSSNYSKDKNDAPVVTEANSFVDEYQVTSKVNDKERLKKLEKPKKLLLTNTDDNDDEVDFDGNMKNYSNDEQNNKRSNKKRRNVFIEDDDDEEEASSVIENDIVDDGLEDKPKSPVGEDKFESSLNKRKLLIDDDSDDETIKDKVKDHHLSRSIKRKLIHDEDEEDNIVDSKNDDVDENHIPTTMDEDSVNESKAKNLLDENDEQSMLKGKKRRRILIEDNEDEE